VPPGRDHECLWIAGLAGLRGAAWCRSLMPVDCWLVMPEGHGPVEITNVRGFPWIAGLAGLRGVAWQSRDYEWLDRWLGRP
jgi:hypothetical protein